MHSSGNTAIKGRSGPDFWANLVFFFSLEGGVVISRCHQILLPHM
jgi:hypothetical protein